MSSNKRRLSKDITGEPKKTKHDVHVNAVSTKNTLTHCFSALFDEVWWNLNQAITTPIITRKVSNKSTQSKKV